MLKKILRKGLIILYWSVLVSFLILFFIGKGKIFGGIAISMYIANTLYYIKNKVQYNDMFNLYKKTYSNLQYAHRERYYAYLSGDEEEIKKYESLVDEGVELILDTSKLLIDRRYASVEQLKQLKEIAEKTKILQSNIQPPV